jgi:hypothetical protein
MAGSGSVGSGPTRRGPRGRDEVVPWPPTPFAFAIHRDGRWLPARGIVSALLVLALVVLASLRPVPEVVGVPVPVMDPWLLVGLVAAGLLDARAGVIGAVAVVLVAAGPSGGLAALPGLAVQSLATILLAGLITLGINELERELWRFLRRGLPAWAGATRYLLAVGLAWLGVSGWIAASPVLLASALPAAPFEQVTLPAEASWAVTAAMVVAPIRAFFESRRSLPARVLPRPSRSWALAGQLGGGATLLVLLSSLFRGSSAQLVAAGLLFGLVRLVRADVVPPPARLFGRRIANTLHGLPPIAEIVTITIVGTVLGIRSGGDLEGVRLALLACLGAVLVFSVGTGDEHETEGSPSTA